MAGSRIARRRRRTARTTETSPSTRSPATTPSPPEDPDAVARLAEAHPVPGPGTEPTRIRRLQGDHGDRGDRGTDGGPGAPGGPDLAAALRQQRARATGRSRADVDQEAAQEGAQRAHGEALLTSSGQRATAEAQQFGLGGGVDHQRIGATVTRNRALGATGFEELLAGRRARTEAMTPVSGATPALDDHQGGLADREARLAELGELRTEASRRRDGLAAVLAGARQTAAEAVAVASWDQGALDQLASAASAALAGLRVSSLETPEQVEAGLGAVQAAIMPLLERAREDIAWMERLQPRTETEIREGVEEFRTTGSTDVMNSAMCQLWQNILSLGPAIPRDGVLVEAKFDGLSSEIDRKTSFDPGRATAALTSGTPRQKADLVEQLQKRASTKRSITEVLKVGYDTKKLLTIVNRLASVDGLATAMAHTTPDDLDQITQRCRDTKVLLRIYRAAKLDGARVVKWLVTSARHDAADLDAYLARGGRAWLDETCGPPALPAGVTKEDIVRDAQPKEGSARPPTNGFAGNRRFTNQGKLPDMLLPARTAENKAITYREYDVQRYRPGVDRGSRRFVKGSDGRFYYTDDHYQTFRKFAP
ncbi:ribonuclease domain-containing protein [Nocardioides dongxiaopingii]|uniref:ribonuclease domain-containing protein n=1 Tax=Nocardioides dongxiaopingii TaxID=2576036 RepID=UPI001BAF4444|nr:ribonuclease domain-containing protein [Nocardioides dongxiaopingii]